MKNLLQYALIGGGAYLLWNYFSKKNKNTAVVADSTEPVGEVNLLESAEMQEEGIQGEDAIIEQAKGADSEVRNTTTPPFNGWDSDTISAGI